MKTWSTMSDRSKTLTLMAACVQISLAVTAWTFAWNRWRQPAWISIDALALLMAAAAIAGAATELEMLTRASRIGSIALLAVLAARVLRYGPMRTLAFITLALITVTLFGGELLDPFGVPGIWFPFNIGVSRTQYLYALVIPLMGLLVAHAISTTPQGRVHPDLGPR